MGCGASTEGDAVTQNARHSEDLTYWPQQEMGCVASGWCGGKQQRGLKVYKYINISIYICVCMYIYILNYINILHIYLIYTNILHIYLIYIYIMYLFLIVLLYDTAAKFGDGCGCGTTALTYVLNISQSISWRPKMVDWGREMMVNWETSIDF